MKDILEFQGEYRWLSNFWPCCVELDGLVFSSVEAAYVAAKTTDSNLRLIIQTLEKPSDCKRIGMSIRLRADWNAVRLPIMEALLRQKFAAGTELADKLRATRDCQIIEGNTWDDTFWGVCKGVGENNLGKLIMTIRRDLIS